METGFKRFFGFRHWAAGLCLIAYLQAAGLTPLLLGLAAALEGSHAAVNVSCGSGQVSVILHHQEAAPSAKTVAHRHGSTSRVVCLLGRNSGQLPDHVATFTCVTACEKIATDPEAKPSETAVPPNLSVSENISSASPSLSGFSDSITAALPSSGLRALRTTLLLI